MIFSVNEYGSAFYPFHGRSWFVPYDRTVITQILQIFISIKGLYVHKDSSRQFS